MRARGWGLGVRDGGLRVGSWGLRARGGGLRVADERIEVVK